MRAPRDGQRRAVLAFTVSAVGAALIRFGAAAAAPAVIRLLLGGG